MIFQRALKRELFSTAAGVFLTLFTITITMMLIRILGQAAKGRVASEDVMALIGFTSLNYMPIILILTGFVSVLLVVTRSYQDSEMVVWFASGLSLTRWLRPVMEFAIPIVVLVTLLGFFVTPWAYIAPKGDVTVSDISTRSMTTMELLTDANSKKMGELVWRIGLPFMSVLLMLLAIPLGFVNPRAGRSFNLIIAVLLYMTYSNLSSFIQAYVSQNKLAFGLAWWPLHLIVALIILLLFALRLGVNSKYHPYVLLSAMKHKRLRDKGNRS